MFVHSVRFMLDARFDVCVCVSGVEEQKKGRARPCVNEEGELGVSNPVPV